MPSVNNNNFELEKNKKILNENLDFTEISKKVDELHFNPKKLCIIENNPTYYDDIKSYLKSVKIEKYNNIIDWKKIEFPQSIYSEKDDKKTRNKKMKILKINVNIINLMKMKILFTLKN